MSAARTIFDQFVTSGWASIIEAVTRRRVETLHLDFKRKQDPASPECSREDRKIFSEALSGFANAEGGVIVWGVDARRQEDIDCAVGIIPVVGPAALAVTLAQLTPEMVSPPVPGVEHVALEDPSTVGSGVVISFVPESDGTPHMARGPGLHRYYRRTNDSFRVLEHYEIADLFGRRAHPVLAVRTEWSIEMQSRSGAEMTAHAKVRFVLENRGRGLARYPALSIGALQGGTTSAYSGQFGGRLPLPVVPAPKPWWMRFAGGGDVVVYPDDEFEVAFVGTAISNLQQEYPTLRIAYSAVAEGTAAIRGEALLDSAALSRMATEYFRMYRW